MNRLASTGRRPPDLQRKEHREQSHDSGNNHCHRPIPPASTMTHFNLRFGLKRSHGSAGGWRCGWTFAVHYRIAGGFSHRHEEPVTSLSSRLDVTRMVGVIAQRLANLANSAVQSYIEVNEGVSRPQRLLQLLPRD